MSTHAVTFDVADVKRAPGPLPEAPYLDAVRALLGKSLGDKKATLEQDAHWYRQMLERGYEVEQTREQLTALEQQIALLEAEQSRGPGTVEACSRYHGRLVQGVLVHPV